MGASSAENVIVISQGAEIHGVLREADQHKSRAVIFCHGAFEFKENWSTYAELLTSEGYATFTFDFTGHGESQGLRSLVDLRVWAYNIRDILNHLQRRGYQRFGLVGWGSGGSAALLAAAHDQRVACAAILSAPVYLVPNIGERAAYGLISAVARVKKAITGKPLTLSRLNELSEMRIAADESANEQYLSTPKVREQYSAVPIPDSLDSVWIDLTRAAARIKIPVVVIHGTDDQIVAANQSERLFSILQGKKELKLIDGSGHALHLDVSKETVFLQISDWLKIHL
jgi:alpha-beta hydrolase superfamily lysophospholipase